MQFSTTRMFAALAASSVVLLAACGGGGGGDTAANAGGGGGGGGGGGTATATSITSNNVREVSAQALAAADSLNGQMTTAASANVLVVGVDTDTAASGLLGVSMGQLYLALDGRNASNLAAGVTVTDTQSCPGGGSLSVTATMANPDKVSSGDNLALTASNCVAGGQRMNGGLSFVFSNVTGTPGASTAWSSTISLRFTNLSIEAAGETALANGDLTVSYNQKGANNASYSASGSSLRQAIVKNGVTTSHTLTAFSYTGAVNGTSYTYNTNFTFAGDLPKLGAASFTVKTNSSFVKNGTAFPSSGSMTVTGAEKSAAIVTAVDSTNVRIELDKNGDGTIDETVNTTWTALKNLL